MSDKTFLGDTGHQLPSAHCLHCKRSLDGATMVNGDERPTPGDITVCIYCGHIMAFADDLSFRELTGEEIHDIAGDERILDIQRARQMADFAKEHP